MGRRSRKQKKIFPCGHKAFGQECPTCRSLQQQTHALAQQMAAGRIKRRRWKAKFTEDPIDLRGLPDRIVRKARRILARLDDGTPYSELGGKRLVHNRKVIRIPVTPSYRMLCEDNDGCIQPKEVISHEQYNSIARNTKR